MTSSLAIGENLNLYKPLVVAKGGDNIERKYYVYAWYNKDKNEVFYIGKGCGKRCYTRKRENRYFTNVINKYDCDVMILKDNLTEREAFDLEILMIWYYRNIGCKLTNMTDGGDNPPNLSGKPKSKEWKEKVRVSHSRFLQEHPEYRKKLSNNLKEFLKTEDGKEFLRKSLEARRTEEFRKAQSIRSRQANNTKEYKQRQSQIVKEMWKSKDYIDSHSGSNNVRAKSVIQYDLDMNFIAEYKTIKEACEITGSQQSKISLVCCGQRKTTNGFIWRYKQGNTEPSSC